MAYYPIIVCHRKDLEEAGSLVQRLFPTFDVVCTKSRVETIRQDPHGVIVLGFDPLLKDCSLTDTLNFFKEMEVNFTDNSNIVTLPVSKIRVLATTKIPKDIYYKFAVTTQARELDHLYDILFGDRICCLVDC